MKGPEPDCELCPIQNFKDQEVSEMGEAAIALTPLRPSCQQVSACLSDLLTVPQGKPATTPYPQANVTLYSERAQSAFCLLFGDLAGMPFDDPSPLPFLATGGRISGAYLSESVGDADLSPAPSFS